MPIVEFHQPGLHRQHSHHQSQSPKIARQASNDKTSLLSNQASASYGSYGSVDNHVTRPPVLPPLPDEIAVKVR